MSLNKTGIETADFTWNLYTGCLRGCSFCYARKLARGRLKNVYTANTNTSPLVPEGVNNADPFFPRYWRDRRDDPYKVPRHYRSVNPHLNPGIAMIFAIDMGDIFGPCIPVWWTLDVLNIIKRSPQIFQILTKYPGNLLYWAQGKGLPDNVWAGVTIINQSKADRALFCLSHTDAAVKYICVEPLQERIVLDLEGVDWMIIGARTDPLILPENEWVEELLEEASRCGTRVFLKKSLRWREEIHQWPCVQKRFRVDER